MPLKQPLSILISHYKDDTGITQANGGDPRSSVITTISYNYYDVPVFYPI